MENYVKTEIIMLTVWSAVMLQSGMLPTSYITNIKNEQVQVSSSEQQARDLFLPYFSEEDLSANETNLLSTSKTVPLLVKKNNETKITEQETVQETKTENAQAEQKSEMETGEQETVQEVKTENAQAEQKNEAEDVEEKKIKEIKTEASEVEQEKAQETETNTTTQRKIIVFQKKPAKEEETEESISEEALKEAERLAKEEEERLAKEKAEAEAEARKLNTDVSTFTFLVNKEYVLSKKYVPELVEPNVNHCQAKGSHKRYMRAEAAEALEQMFAAAKADGYDLWVKTAYRSYQNQYDTYTWTLKYRGVQEAVYYHAVPGASEHQTGLAVDIVCKATNYDNNLSFEKTKEYAWLKENCYKYGFTLRYLEGKENITGYNYEPWHYRYVGVELATYLMEHGMTLEEYYNALPTTDLFQVPEKYRYLIQEDTESK